MKKLMMVAMAIIVATGACFSADKFEKRAKKALREELVKQGVEISEKLENFLNDK